MSSEIPGPPTHVAHTTTSQKVNLASSKQVFFPLLFLLAFVCASATLLALPQKTEAAIAFGNSTTIGFDVQVTCVSQVCTLTAPTISGSDTVLLISMSLNADQDFPPLSATYDGVTLASPFDSGAVNFTRTLVWVVTNPGSAKNFAATFDPSNTNRGVITAVYYTGVSQSGSYRTETVGTGLTTPATLSVTNSQSSDTIVGFFSINDTTLVNGFTLARVGAGQTFRSQEEYNGESQLAISDEPGASGTVTHSWTFVNDGNNGWAGVAFPLVAAPSRATTLIKPPNNLGLVGYWSFNEGIGTIATDFSGNGNAGTLSTAIGSIPTWVNGKRGQALDFELSNTAFVDVGSAASLQLTGAMTVCAWVKAESLNAADESMIVARVNPSGTTVWPYAFYAKDVSGSYRVGFNWSDDSGTAENYDTTGDAMSLGVWTHLCAARNSALNDVDIYVNGADQAVTATNNVSVTTNSPKTSIGRFGDRVDNTLHWDGLIDEVRIYNRQLSATEVASLARAGAVKFTTSSAALQTGSSLANGLVGLWTFDGADVTSNLIVDRSAQGNNGGFFGAATSSAKTIGKLGQALHFDGVSTFARVDGVADDVATGAASVAFWFKLDSTFNTASPGDLVPLSVSDASSNNDLRFRFISSGGIVPGSLNWQTFMNNDAPEDTYSGITSWKAGTWYHIVGTISANGLSKKMYVDGVLEASGTPSNPRGGNVSTQAYLAELDNGNDKFPGSLDDVRFYNRELSPQEVKQLYQLGTTKMVQ